MDTSAIAIAVAGVALTGLVVTLLILWLSDDSDSPI